LSVFFFFFQAEDGIRDLTVTGVQTCSSDLPAARRAARPPPACARRATASAPPPPPPRRRSSPGPPRTPPGPPTAPSTRRAAPGRSEERRVGKERPARRTTDGEAKKQEDTSA